MLPLTARRFTRLLGFAAILLLAIVLSPVALAISAAWFIWRGVVYATARQAYADIVGWVGEGAAEAIESALAYPIVEFADHDGQPRRFTSRFGFRIYDDPPPAGRQVVRYHLKPVFHADLDRPSDWFTGSALSVVLALFGTFLAWAGRMLALPLF